MRIGEAETDRLFQKSLEPALRQSGCMPVRIDRVDFNDDIDDRIVAEIRRADLVVADLTFARPSVYYEGGFAAGLGKPVIYTSRRDHLSPKADDPLGNFRVHFDLQMKNIIPWREPDSAAFRTMLARRLRRVVTPLVRSRAEETEATKAKQQFRSLPSTERLSVASTILRKRAQAWGYQLVDLAGSGGHPYREVGIYRPPISSSGRVSATTFGTGFIGTRNTPGSIDAMWIRVAHSLQPGALTFVNALLEFAPPHDMNPRLGARPKRLVEHVILCSLEPLPMSRVRSAFPKFRQLDDSTLLATFDHRVPTTHIDAALLFVSRNVFGLWNVVAFRRDRRGRLASSGTDFHIDDDVIRRQRPNVVVRIPSTKKQEAERYETLGRTKMLSRSVIVHVIAGVDSPGQLRAVLLGIESTKDLVDRQMAT